MPGLEVRSMAREELKARDKIVTRMTREGAVEENLTEGTSERISKRIEDTQLVTPHDTETGDIAEEVRKRRQLRPEELEMPRGKPKPKHKPQTQCRNTSRESFRSATTLYHRSAFRGRSCPSG